MPNQSLYNASSNLQIYDSLLKVIYRQISTTQFKTQRTTILLLILLLWLPRGLNKNKNNNITRRMVEINIYIYYF
jgi:hypothetical protein